MPLVRPQILRRLDDHREVRTMLLPLSWYYPFRYGVVHLPRGSIRRNCCVLVLKLASRHLSAVRMTSEIRPLDDKSVRFASVDSSIMETIFWFGLQGYEGKLVSIWASLCKRAKSVLEVGGNVGLYTVIGGRATCGHYTVVEPVPKLARILRENLSRNSLVNVEVLEGAAVPQATNSPVSLNIPNEGRAAPVGAHLTSGVEVSARTSSAVINVKALPFHELAVGRDLMKIDAEGIEYQLLMAISDVLVSQRPTLLIEVLPEATLLGTLIRDLAKRARYTIFIIPAFGSDTIVRIAPEEFSSNILPAYNSKDVVLTTDAQLDIGRSA